MKYKNEILQERIYFQPNIKAELAESNRFSCLKMENHMI